MGNKKITVLISTYNEEARIEDCLKSVKWADELVVVDSHSEDRTAEIARKYTDKVFLVDRTGFPCREGAMKYVSNDWLFIVDADELVPAKLMKALRKIADEDSADMVFIPRKNYFCGREMAGTGWGPSQDVQMRFGKKSFFVAKDVVHEDFGCKEGARIKLLTDTDVAFVHFGYYDIDHFISKLNKYTAFEAKNTFDGRKKEIGLVKMIFQVLVEECFGRFVVKKGYKDGLEGVTFSMLMGAYRLSAYSKYKMMKNLGSKDVRAKVDEKYRTIAKAVVAGYVEEKHVKEEIPVLAN